jgi:hypothetical protein
MRSRVLDVSRYQQFAAINVLADPGYINGPRIIPNTCKVVLNWNLTSGHVAHNVLYAAYTGASPISVAIANAMHAQMTLAGGNWDLMAGFLANTVNLAGITLVDIRSETGLEISSTDAPKPGTSISTALPDEMALAVSIATQVRGPSGRGRFYLPGFASNAMGAGNVVATPAFNAVAAWAGQTFYNSILQNIGQPGLGLFARAAYTSPITGRQFPARASNLLVPVTFGLRDNHWDTQRRRGLR